MRIVHVVRQFAPGIGGIEDVVRQLARQQVAAGHEVRVVTLDRIFDAPGDARLPARETIDGIEVRRIPWRGSRRYPIAPAALGHVRDADIVHVHAVDFFHDWLALTWPLHRRPMVLSTHGLFFHTRFAAGLKRLFFNTVTRAATRAYRCVIASSEQDRERFADIRSHDLIAIENGVALGKFAGRADPAARTIIYFGRLAPNKRVDLVIDWFAQVASLAPGWRLILAGKPMGVEPGALAAQADRLGIGDLVEIHAMPSDAEMASLVGRSSVYACASDYEGFGIAAIEAAAAGLWPVLSPIPPFRRNLARIGRGMILDFEAPDAAATFLARFADPETHRGLSAEAMERAFGWRGVAGRFEDAYRAAMSPDPSARRAKADAS